MQPLISIVMPVYNASGYLEDAVRGVSAQPGEEWELILVNDGSTDASGDLCDALAGEDGRIRVIHMPGNHGLSAARNAGMAAAAGRYLMFMDSDDWLETYFIDRLLSRIREGNVPQLMVWGVTEEHFGPEGELVETRTVRCDAAEYKGHEAVRRCALELEEKTLLGYAWNKLYDMELIRSSGAEFEKVTLIEDILFNLRILPHAETIGVLEDTPYHYARRNEGSLTHRFLPDYYALSMRRVEEMLNLYEGWGMGEEAKRTLAPIYVRYTLSALQRNCDPRAKMTAGERMRFAEAAFRTPLHRRLAPFIGTGGGLTGLIGKVMKTESTALSLLMGRGVYLVNTKMSGLFTKLSGPQQGGKRREAAEHRSSQL